MKNPKTGGVSTRHPLSRRRPRGFALVISLSLMVLLTILAVGLLGLSSLSLATAGREADLAEARANARMSLALAIAQLQKQTGPDQRVTVTADQLSEGGDGSTSSAAADRRHWTGVYESWNANTKVRPEPRMLSWLVSGETKDLEQVATAKSAGNEDDSVPLVDAGTTGSSSDGLVRAPALRVESASGTSARIAWWSGDQGMKAAVSTPPLPEDTGFAGIRGMAQGAPRNAVEFVSSGTSKPFESLEADNEQLGLVTDWQQAGFLADEPRSPRALFHDLAPYSSGLMTNVRAGGFRKDLSMQLERPISNAASTALYTVGGEPGINLQELRAYYNLYKPTELKTSGGSAFAYTTGGGKLPANGPFLQLDSGPQACANDEEFHLKMPVIINYQLALSLQTRIPTSDGGVPVPAGKQRLHIVADPIVTLWNPLDVPVALPTSTFVSVKYWQIPYTLIVKVNGVSNKEYPLATIISGARQYTNSAGTPVKSDGDGNFCSLVVGDSQQLVFKPGEVIKTSQQGPAGSVRHRLPGKAGFFSQHGYALPVASLDNTYVDIAPTDTITYELRPNNFTAGKSASSGNWVTNSSTVHSRHFSLTHHEVYVGFDRATNGDYSQVSDSLGFGGMYIDYDFGNKRARASDAPRALGTPGTKTGSGATRLYANNFPSIFRPIKESDGRPLPAASLGTKAPIALFSYSAKTENGGDLGTRFLARFNPKVHHIDFFDLTSRERDMLPYEFSVEPLVSWKNRSLDVDTGGSAYFGGGLNTELGSSFVTTHSVPREPIVSLAAFQHSFANGFDYQKPKYGYSTLNGREPMMPHIAHAIGNSMAPSVLASNKTEGTLPGNRPLADHSYLANLALWDDYFLSGIAPQTVKSYNKSRAQRLVAEEFLTGKTPLPVVRYLPDLDGQDSAKLVNSLFSGATPTTDSINLVAAHLRVDGMFNVNSTSVEAWKAVLGSLRGRPVVVRDASGSESISPSTEDVPVSNLHGPMAKVVDGSGNLSPQNPDQWTGRRELTEDEIEVLAEAIVKEVRKRGPFLCLGDFINRRVGNDKELARAGAIQSALDSKTVDINNAFNSGGRSVSSTVANRFAFPEAEQGPMAFGSPTIVKQADILTPIAPVLSARSDSFIIRSYGESVDKNGKVLARAWCEAVVERDRNFIDPADKPQTPVASLSSDANKTFGRRYEIVSFRWLHPDEI